MKKILGIVLVVLLSLPLTMNVFAEVSIPDERLLPRMVDNSDLFTDEEETTLLERLDEISERQQVDVAVVTTTDLEGKTPEAYADDWYDYNGYGFSESRDGLLFLISTGERDWHISTCGYGIEAFTDAGIQYMSEKFLPDLKQDKFYEACMVFADLSDEFITQAKNGEPYDAGNLPKGSVPPVWIAIDLVIGLILGFIITKAQASKLKTVKKQTAAHNYVVPGSQVITYHRDQFMNQMVSQRTIVRESSSGGSSTHTSSSGTTHGGGGGKF